MKKILAHLSMLALVVALVPMAACAPDEGYENNELDVEVEEDVVEDEVVVDEPLDDEGLLDDTGLDDEVHMDTDLDTMDDTEPPTS